MRNLQIDHLFSDLTRGPAYQSLAARIAEAGAGLAPVPLRLSGLTLAAKAVYAVLLHHATGRPQLIVVDGNKRIVAAYHGTVAVDPTTHAVMRLIVVAENIPADFPVKSTQDVLDYDYQEISGQTFLLPLKATMTANLGDFWSKNDKEFRI